MRNRIILILLSAFGILALMFFLWFWLLRGPATAPTNTGQLGEGDPRTPTTGTGGVGGNVVTPIGGGQTTGGITGGITGGTTGGTNVQTPIRPGYGTSIPTAIPTFTPTTGFAYPTYIPGAVWIDGRYTTTTTTSGGGSTVGVPGGVSGTGSPQPFTPTPINQLVDVSIAGTGYFPNTPNGSAGGGGGGGGLLGLGIAAVGCTASLLGGVAGGGTTGGVGGAATGIGAVTGVPVSDNATHVILTTSFSINNAIESSEAYKENFLDCIARTIARAAIDRITADIVDWINSGFDGKPAFVQDFRSFLNDVGNQAAGEFISGSKLAFLCSPFQLQVKIAVAKSYAQRSSGGSTNACTLSDVTNNIREFIDGNFSQGGWPAFIQFTTVPSNNPFGAYMAVEAQIGNEIASAQAEAQFELSLGDGFLSARDENGNIVTPGAAIEGALERTLGQSLESLQLADNFDEIISALISQLMTRALYGGLSNLSGNRGYANTFISAQDEQAIAAAEALLASLQSTAQYAQQYGSAKQGSISDVQNAQNLLQSLANCWSVTASSSNLTTAQQGQALTNMRAASDSIQSLETRVTLFNNDITRANAAIAKVEQFQTSALAATTKAEVDGVAADFQAARNSGVLMNQADVTEAQQDRATLQTEMAALNQTTNTEVAQCYAFGQ